jgi:hypothetical protein
MIAVVSMRHTGTHFLSACLGGAEWYSVNPSAPVVKLHVRSLPKNLDRKIVVPWRDRELVKESWTSRGYDMRIFNEDWALYEALPGFRFDMDTKPFDALEAYVGKPVVRLTEVIRHPDKPRNF